MMLRKRFFDKLLRAAAASSALVVFSASSPAQDYGTYQQPGHFASQNAGNGSHGLSLPQQATGPPIFPDQQGNDYTAMSPDSWGHPNARQSTNNRWVPPLSSGTPVAQLSAGNVVGQSPLARQPAGRYPMDQLSATPTPVKTAAMQVDSLLGPLTNTERNRPARFARLAQRPTGNAAADAAAMALDLSKVAAYSGSYSQKETTTPSPDGSNEVAFPFTRRTRVVEPPRSGGTVGGFDELSLDGPQSSSTVAPLDIAPPDLSRLELSAPLESGGPIAGPQSTSAPTTNDFFEPNAASDLSNAQPEFSATPSTQPFDNGDSKNSGPIAPVAPAVGDSIAPGSGLAADVFLGQPSHHTQSHVPPQGTPIDHWPITGEQQNVINWPSASQRSGEPVNFRPDLGHRDAFPTQRTPHLYDDGEKFGHETKKKEYPPFKEIINTGRFFYNAEVAALRPHFLGNTGISSNGPTFTESQTFDFDTNFAPSFKAGFESQYGPGVELSYRNVSGNGEVLSSASDGITSVVSTIELPQPGQFSSLSAVNAGESLVANHAIELETFGLNFFKELKFPISRLNGKFGFTYANIAQTLEVTRLDGANNQTGELEHKTDFRGYGPQFALEYFRPVGHTPLTLVTSFGGKGLFGRRDQFVTNSDDVPVRRFGSDEFVTVIDFTGGVQFRKLLADNRYLTARFGYLHQSYLGGGTAVDAQGDFGLNGIVFGIGLNR